MSDYFDPDVNRVAAGSLARSAQLNSLRDDTSVAFDKLPAETEFKRGIVDFGMDTGIANTYTVALPYSQTVYTSGLKVSFNPLNDNTGPSTINVDGIGPIGIKRMDGTDLEAGDMLVDQIVALQFNGTDFRFVGSVPVELYATKEYVLASIEAGGDPGDLPITELGVGTATSKQRIRVNEAGTELEGYTVLDTVATTGGGELVEDIVNEIQDSNTYTLPAASNYAAGSSVVVEVSDVYSAQTPLVQRSGSDTISDEDGTDTEVLFNSLQSIRVRFITDGVSDWRI